MTDRDEPQIPGGRYISTALAIVVLAFVAGVAAILLTALARTVL